MALKAKKRVEPHWVTPEDEIDEESPARFKVRALTSSEQLDVLDTFDEDGAPGTRTFRDCFKIGAVGFENVELENGKPCKSARRFMQLQDMFDYVLEIGAEVFNKSFVTDEEKKTSSSES